MVRPGVAGPVLGLDPQADERPIQRGQPRGGWSGGHVLDLTDQEASIVEHIADGHRADLIATMLGLGSASAVHASLRRARLKTGAATTAHLVALYLEATP